jgi:anti-anti-sigma factor
MLAGDIPPIALPDHAHVRGLVEGRSALLRPSGAIDLAAGQALRDAVREALDAGAREVVVDLAEVTLLDSAGVGVLLKCARDIRRAGGALACDCPPAAPARPVLELAGVRDLVGLR